MTLQYSTELDNVPLDASIHISNLKNYSNKNNDQRNEDEDVDASNVSDINLCSILFMCCLFLPIPIASIIIGGKYHGDESGFTFPDFLIIHGLILLLTSMIILICKFRNLQNISRLTIGSRVVFENIWTIVGSVMFLGEIIYIADDPDMAPLYTFGMFWFVINIVKIVSFWCYLFVSKNHPLNNTTPGLVMP